MGKIVTKKADKDQKEVNFKPVVDNEKIRLSLVALADKIDEASRNHIMWMYNNREVLNGYAKVRASGVYEQGAKKGAHHRKIVEFPDPVVFEFVNAVLGALYGPDWLYDNRALQHELVRPWHVVKNVDYRKFAKP